MDAPQRTRRRWQFALWSLMSVVFVVAFAIWPWPQERHFLVQSGLKMQLVAIAGQVYFGCVAEPEVTQERGGDFALGAGMLTGVLNLVAFVVSVNIVFRLVPGLGLVPLCGLSLFTLFCLTAMALSWAFDEVSSATAMVHICGLVGIAVFVAMVCGGALGGPAEFLGAEPN